MPTKKSTRRTNNKPLGERGEQVKVRAKRHGDRPVNRLQEDWPDVTKVPWAGYRIKTVRREGIDELSWCLPEGDNLDHDVPECHRGHIAFYGKIVDSVDPSKRGDVTVGQKLGTAGDPNAKNRARRGL